ncbi:MAG TPA: hypothetical protein PLQ29_09615, partial [Spirochaetales bacterium]|nr:hypothetical protein [Spirochaetales bacterium]
MRSKRARTKETEPLERVASLGVLALSVAVFVFGFAFVSSGFPVSYAEPAESVGAADLADATGSAGIADAESPDGLDAIVDEVPPPDDGLFYMAYRVV